MYILQKHCIVSYNLYYQTVGCSCVGTSEHQVDSLYIKCCTCNYVVDAKTVL